MLIGNLRWLVVSPPSQVFLLCCYSGRNAVRHSLRLRRGRRSRRFVHFLHGFEVSGSYFWSWPDCFCVLYRLAMLLKSTSGSLSRFLSILGSWEMSFTNFSHWKWSDCVNWQIVPDSGAAVTSESLKTIKLDNLWWLVFSTLFRKVSNFFIFCENRWFLDKIS